MQETQVQSLGWEDLLVTCEMNVIVWEFEHTLALPFFGIGMKTDFFSPVAIAEFAKLLAY